MLSFEEYVGIEHFSLSTDNYMRQFKHHNREVERQKKHRKFLNIIDSILGALFMVDIILFVLFVNKTLTQKGQDEALTEQYHYEAQYSVNSSDEVKIESDVEKFSAEDTDNPKYNILATYPEPLQSYEHSAKFTVTHYCGCSKCCGSWSSGSESVAYGCKGDKLVANYSIATDPNVIPYGTILHDSEGNEYMAQDTGKGIKGNRIDLFVGDHQEALNMGIKEMTLFW